MVSVRGFAACLAAAGVLSLAFLPPEHLHFSAGHDHHHADVVHRHYAPHESVVPQARHLERGDDDDPIWLTTPFIGADQVRHVAPVDQSVAGHPLATPPPLTRVEAIATSHPSIHAPPLKLAFGLRAPPALLV